MSIVTPYSAEVVLSLLVGGISLALSHVGPNELLVRDECKPPPAGDAKVFIRVDDSKRVRCLCWQQYIDGARLLADLPGAANMRIASIAGPTLLIGLSFWSLLMAGMAAAGARAAETRIPVTFSGGHETD